MGRHHGSRHSGSHHRSSSHRSSHRSSSHSHSRSRSRSSYHSYSGGTAAPSPEGYKADQQYKTKPAHPTGEYETLWYDDETGGFSYSYKYPYIKDTVDTHIREKEPPVIHYLSMPMAITGAFFLFTFAMMNLAYEIFIIPFECIDMSDVAFDFIDDFLYVGQYLVALIPIIKSIIDNRKMAKYKFEVTKQAVEYYKLQEKLNAEREAAERERRVTLTVCPSCGASVEQGDRFCPYCNTVLERYTDENTMQSIETISHERDEL